MSITINVSKAKEIAHAHRREARAAEFAPLDHQIAAQIPGTDFEEVEAARQEIRDRYDVIQNNINVAENPDEIKSAMTFLQE